MSYSAQAQLAQDGFFVNRVAACAATQPPVTGNPVQWAVDHVWDVAAAPGFGDAYESAIVGGVPNPGDDPSVISDAMILSAVQTVLAASNPRDDPGGGPTEAPAPPGDDPPTEPGDVT